LILISFILPNAIDIAKEDILPGITSFFFLLTTAAIMMASQTFAYRAQRQLVLGKILLESTKANLETAHEQLKQLDRFRSQVLANITHELKTPLTMILSPLEQLLEEGRGQLGDEQKATLTTMFRNGLKLLKLIGDILDLSKLSESRIRLRIAEQDLTGYLRGLVAQIQPLAQRKQIDLELDAPPGANPVWCDLDRLERVFVNLLSNAAKFTPPGGWIKVTVRDEGPTTLVEVCDSGPGFEQSRAEQIFERFVQLEMGASRRYGGTGLGLALARELVELHGGKIWAESRPGEGARFFVRLQRDREHFLPETLDRRGERRDVPDGKRDGDRGLGEWVSQLTAREEFRLLDIAEATERRIVERDPGEERCAYTVLVVEDTPDVIRVVHMSLRGQFRVLAAEDGQKGLELARARIPDLVLTDLMMPGIDGLELTRRLRLDPATRHIPVVMLTARGDLDDKVAGLQAGVNAYLVKPFSHRELIGTVRSLLQIQETQADVLLASRLGSLETVASGLAHEINNPLNYIQNSLGVLRSDLGRALALARRETAGAGPPSPEETALLAKLDARVQKMLETAEAGVHRIAKTVELMRSYSREGYTRALRPHDLFAATREVIELVRPAIGREVQVEASFTGDGTVEGVPEELNQVLTNLIQNGIEASPEGTGRVLVTGRQDATEVVLTVADNGPGVPTELRDQIFNPFFTTKSAGRGMGMGLTMAWRVVQALGGTLQLAPRRAGQGAEFVVRLPRPPQSKSSKRAPPPSPGQ
jgi:signal transduction histidine kinase